MSPWQRKEKFINVLLPEKLSRSPTATDYEILTYFYLKLLSPLSEIDRYYINIDALLFAIYGNCNYGLKIRRNVYAAINSLVSNGYISGIRQGKDSFIIDTVSLNVDKSKEKYTLLFQHDVDKIMKSSHSIKLQLFRYYVYLMDSVNTKTTVYLVDGKSKSSVVGYQTQEQLSSVSGLSTRTIIRYNTMLEELSVIYVCRSDDFTIDKDGLLSQFPNVYGRYTNREYIQKYAQDYKQYKKSYKQVQKKKGETNDNRKLAQKYYWLCRGHQYSEEEISRIYCYIVQNNKKYESLYDEEGNEDYLNKIKDLSVFDNYDFLERKE
ncbi:hypothetical protein [Clostridium sp. HBUAS56010]|uniref:hypothetical protein n=1 Tax=Clostridium sp. HBUAS56010 TaxID=2571127 RepID=UPI0011785157|nr:hypothetical protein [Clostridium sp. HBUAS56010]